MIRVWLILVVLPYCRARYFDNPVIKNIDNPDPGVLLFNGTYYATTTSSDNSSAHDKFPIYSSVDLQNWQLMGHIINEENYPVWSTNVAYWAPELNVIGENHFLAYFTTRDSLTQKMAIAAAYSSNILGPYAVLKEPLVRDWSQDVLDATLVRYKNSLYLFWKGREWVYGSELDPSGLSFQSNDTRLIIRNDLSWEAGIIEGPWVITRNETLYLFYSGNEYCTDKYAVGVAKSDSLSVFGKWEKKSEPILVSDDDFKGPGHCSVVRDIDGKSDVIVYHAYITGAVCNSNPRVMMAKSIAWNEQGIPPVEGWPIMLWFHPGNLSVGATSLWDGSAIAIGQKVIVVTASYRLNLFGFLSTLDHHIPGNMGLLDQVAALDWVRDKIGVFGGNAKNVVLSGHSGGGVSVGLHMLSPHSHGKFSKAIIMSAKGLVSRSVKTASQIATALHTVADTFGCEPMSNMLVECLRRQSATHLLDHTKEILSEFGPIVDRSYVKNMLPFLPDDPVTLINNQQFARVPVLTGYTDMEEALDLLEQNENTHRGVSWDDYNMAISESVSTDISDLNGNDTCLEFLGTSHLYETAVFYYTPRPLTLDGTILRERLIALLTEKYYGSGAYFLATALNQVNTPSYVYRFDYKIKTDNFIRFPRNESHLPVWINAPHQFDLPFAWGMPYWTNLLKNLTWNSADKKMTDTILALWGNFVKFGNPTSTGVSIRWDTFRENTSGVMLLDRNSNMSDVTNFDYKAFEFWNNYYPRVYNVLLQSCNMSSTARSWHIREDFYFPYYYLVLIHFT